MLNTDLEVLLTPWSRVLLEKLTGFADLEVTEAKFNYILVT
jgi:hypothetical protein